MILARPALLLAALTLPHVGWAQDDPDTMPEQLPPTDAPAQDTGTDESPDLDPSAGSEPPAAGPAPTTAPAVGSTIDARPGRSHVAVVVGISGYVHLPDAVELDFGRADAATLAKTLQDKSGFDKVFLLGDGEATKSAITEVLRTRVPQLAGPDDMLLIYFVGHGIGADLGLPVLLAADSTLQNGQVDGFELTQLAQDLQTWNRAGSTLIVTDVVHRNALDGISFYGPAADQWPTLPPGWLVLSATRALSPGRDGAFGSMFAEAMAGRADRNQDRMVTAGELLDHLEKAFGDKDQHPLAAGTFDETMVLATDVTEGPAGPPPPRTTQVVTVVQQAEPVAVPEPIVKVQWPEYSVSKAKFVWQGGSGQSVKCREHDVVACEGSCYVHEFKAGPCALRAIYDGVQMEGEAVILGPGGYTCTRRGGALECKGP